MRRKLSALLLALASFSCVGRSELTENRAIHCVSETFTYAEMTRGVTEPVELMVDAVDEDFIRVSAFAAGDISRRRLGTFRVGMDRQIWKLDIGADEWRLIGVCD